VALINHLTNSLIGFMVVLSGMVDTVTPPGMSMPSLPEVALPAHIVIQIAIIALNVSSIPLGLTKLAPAAPCLASLSPAANTAAHPKLVAVSNGSPLK
jgi:hypothetical protein